MQILWPTIDRLRCVYLTIVIFHGVVNGANGKVDFFPAKTSGFKDSPTPGADQGSFESKEDSDTSQKGLVSDSADSSSNDTLAVKCQSPPASQCEDIHKVAALSLGIVDTNWEASVTEQKDKRKKQFQQTLLESMYGPYMLSGSIPVGLERFTPASMRCRLRYLVLTAQCYQQGTIVFASNSQPLPSFKSLYTAFHKELATFVALLAQRFKQNINEVMSDIDLMPEVLKPGDRVFVIEDIPKIIQRFFLIDDITQVLLDRSESLVRQEYKPWYRDQVLILQRKLSLARFATLRLPFHESSEYVTILVSVAGGVNQPIYEDNFYVTAAHLKNMCSYLLFRNPL